MTYPANPAAIPPTIPPTAWKREGMAGGLYPAAIHFPIGGGGIGGPKGRRDEFATEAGVSRRYPATEETMTNQPPEIPALQDARIALQRAASALRAAASVAPRLIPRAGDLHAACIDMAEQVRDLEVRR